MTVPEDLLAPSTVAPSPGSEVDDEDEFAEFPPWPFNKAAADATLRTSDQCDLQVFRWIIEDASPVLKTMLSKAPVLAPSGCVRISLPESQSTLVPLLRLCYPEAEPPIFSSFDEAIPLLLAAQKYELAFASRVLQTAAIPHMTEDPLRAYAFAGKHGLKEIMRVAAKAYLRIPAGEGSFPGELEDLSGGAYHRLTVYRARCSSAMDTLNIDRAYAFVTCMHCGWFARHWERLLGMLRMAPHPATLEDLALANAATDAAWPCQRCRKTVAGDMRRFTEQYKELVEKIIDKVRDSPSLASCPSVSHVKMARGRSSWISPRTDGCAPWRTPAVWRGAANVSLMLSLTTVSVHEMPASVLINPPSRHSCCIAGPRHAHV